jgi:hypothetical protein
MRTPADNATVALISPVSNEGRGMGRAPQGAQRIGWSVTEPTGWFDKVGTVCVPMAHDPVRA